MIGLEILDVCIGLVFLYVSLAIVCSGVSEIISNWLKWRANDLEEGLQNLLKNPKWVDAIYGHPLVAALYRDGKKPSYIPSRAFALAVVDKIASSAPIGPNGTINRSASLGDIRGAIARIPDSEISEQLKGALLSLADDVEGDLNALKRSLATWFDDAMDRLASWYKRNIQRLIFAMAAAVAVVLNADTVTIAEALWRNPTLRASIVATAQQQAQSAPAQGGLQQPDPGQGGGRSQAAQPSSPYDKLSRDLTSIRELGLPLGWNRPASGPRGLPGDLPGLLAEIGAVLMKAVGLTLTAAAISLGAPFWFDVLNKLVNVRGTIRPPEDRVDETS